MENTQTNDSYIQVLFCDGCENRGNNWRQMGSDECDRRGEYPAAAGVVVLETKAAGSYDVGHGLKSNKCTLRPTYFTVLFSLPCVGGN